MNPLETMAIALAKRAGQEWSNEPEHEGFREAWLADARAARDALADNVDMKMCSAFLDHNQGLGVSIAAAIRAAGEG